MLSVNINGQINLTYPEGFNEMGEEELIRYFSSPDNRWGVYEPDKHVIISVSWKKAGFFSFMSDAESIIIGAESRMRRNLLNYQRTKAGKMKLCGKKIKAYGITFEYRVNDKKIVQVGDLVVFKYKKFIYAIHYIGRKANEEENRPVFDELIKSLTVQ